MYVFQILLHVPDKAKYYIPRNMHDKAWSGFELINLVAVNPTTMTEPTDSCIYAIKRWTITDDVCK